MVFAKLVAHSPPPPSFTPGSIIDLSSKVYIITNCTVPTNISFASILYKLHATVYIGTSSTSVHDAIALQLRKECPASKGHIKSFIHNATDLNSIKSAVQIFLNEQWRLDVLFLDATTSSNDNVLPSFLLAKLLRPIMHTTASHFCHPNPSIRVIWIANSSIFHSCGRNSAYDFYLLAHEFVHRGYSHVDDARAHILPNSNPLGVQHVVVDHMLPASAASRLVSQLMPSFVQRTQYAAYTLLYAGLGPDVRSGDWIIPWRRKGNVPENVTACAMRTEGNGKSPIEIFYERCKDNAEPFVQAACTPDSAQT
jgi:retinol dehydrogenase-12